MTSRPEVLQHGRFLGETAAEREAGGFLLADRAATVPEHEVHPHSHADAHLVLVMVGDYVSSAAGAPTLSRGVALVYNPPGTEHRDRFRGTGGRFITIAVSPATLRGLGDAVALPDQPEALSGRAIALASNAARRLNDRGPGTALHVESLCTELMAEVAQHGRREREPTPPWLWQVRERLHAEGEPNLATLAREFGVHPVSLSRGFRRAFGLTPGAYLRRCRLDRAAAMVAANRLPLHEVALHCGYFDQAHFTRDFRRAYGRTPMDVRRVG